jgi:hypothetical protein
VRRDRKGARAGLPAARVLAIIAALALAGLGAGSAGALDWPVAARIVTGTFGEDRGDHFHNGVDIGGGSQEVHPVLPGELVFRYDEGEDYTSLPRGVGSFVVVRHEQHIRTVYAHLQAGSLGPVRDRYDTTDRIGIIGETGHASGPHLHFTVFDEEAGSAVNPLEFLPPVPDHQAPVIRRLFAVVGEHPVPLVNGAVLQPGKTEILAEAYDLREDVAFRWPLGPASVSLSLDGRDASRITFDSLQVAQGRAVLGGSLLSREQVWDPGGLLICGSVTLARGESVLRLSVRDLAGNEAVQSVEVSVTP